MVIIIHVELLKEMANDAKGSNNVSYIQGFGSGLDPDSIRSVDPASRRAKMTQEESRKN
jgi:hypothetical protein